MSPMTVASNAPQVEPVNVNAAALLVPAVAPTVIRVQLLLFVVASKYPCPGQKSPAPGDPVAPETLPQFVCVPEESTRYRVVPLNP